MSLYPHGDPVEEARLLLPWYITGKLTAPERKLVERMLETHPELADEYRRELKLVDMIRANTALLELSAVDTTQQRLEKLMKRIERDERANAVPASAPVSPRIPPRDRLGEAKQWIRNLLPSWQGLTPANAVFAFLLLLQAGFLGWFANTVSNPPEGIYVSATVAADPAAVPVVKGMVLLVDFNGDARIRQVREFLSQWNARILDGPNETGYFKIEMKGVVSSDPQASAILQQMQQDNAVIAFIGREY
ncbi:MAG: hypothetical protein BWK73_34470 [Thiothrix lacustris]|uniref:Zinc-finger domain-containing protein n=1 Tax=Thiothrix lacustris TaxID=525917 RepID=A0A1Y1QGJ6_9GAMM|nr:MAG: hypothetical protein BWK73_34470 [Thiothrix lacustris]